MANRPIVPTVGTRVSASQIRDRITDPLYQNDTSAEARLAILEAAISAMPVDHYQDSMPAAAAQYDRWTKTSGQMYLCITAYTTGNGTLAKWKAITDLDTNSLAGAAQSSANSASRTILSNTMPDAAMVGWIWVETDASNRTRVCNTSYTSGNGSITYWTPTDDHMAALLAAAQQGLRDGKTNTFFQPTVPDAADARDGWIDTDDDNAAYTCSASYISTDGEAWNSATTYAIGQIVQHEGSAYQAILETTNDEPPDPTYWSELGGGYPTIDTFREQRWVSISDPTAQAAAAAAQAVADGKTYTFYANTWPTAADARDLFHDYDDNKTYICISAYTAAFEGDRSTKWTRIYDPVAQARADAAYALADGKVVTYIQASMPDSADIKDLWFDSDDSYKMYVCTVAYTSGAGTAEKWAVQTDNSKAVVYSQDEMPSAAVASDLWIDTDNDRKQYLCIQTYTSGGTLGVNWLSTNDNKKVTYIQGTPPDEADVGDGWLDNVTVSGQYQFYVCNTAYTDGGHNWTSLSSPGKWTPAKDKATETLAINARNVADSALVNANAALALLDGKIDTYVQASIPDAADLKDVWLDADDSYQMYVCTTAYTTGNGNYSKWTAQTPSTIAQTYAQDAMPSTANTSDIWIDTDDNRKQYVCAQSYTSGGTIGVHWLSTNDNKKTNYYRSSPPSSADIGDGWMDTNTENGDFQFYVCSAAYTNDGHGYVDDTNTGVWKAAKDKNAETIAENARSVANSALDQATAALAILDGKLDTFVQSSMPTAADIKDIWMDSDDNYKIYICNSSYTVGNGSMSNWTSHTSNSIAQTYSQSTVPLSANDRDIWVDTSNNNKTYVCAQSYTMGGTIGVNWLATSDDKKTNYISPSPPDAADVGDGWLDTVTGTGQYQFYVCNSSYTDGAHGWSSYDNPGKWTPAVDRTTLDLANTALNTAQGKTTTYYQQGMPTTAGYGDTWVDTDDRLIYVCISPYQEGEGSMSNWDQTADPVAQQTADAANALADSKRRTFYSDEVPSALALGYPIDIGDLWCDTNDNYKMYICKQTYNDAGSLSYWQETQDPTARQVAMDAASAVDNKRTTFQTNAAGHTSWPGPGEAGQIPISFWDAVGGAELGDIWIHYDTSSGGRYVWYCIEAYDGYANGDIGGMDHWTSWAGDASLITAMSDLLPRDGSRAMTGNLNMGNHDITNAKAIGCQSITATGAVAGNTVAATLGVSGASASFTGQMSSQSVSCSAGGSFGDVVSVAAATADGHALNRITADGRYPVLSGGKIPMSYMQAELMSFKGNWNANTNSPSLLNSDGDIATKVGDTYRVTVAGTTDHGAGNVTYQVGDWVYTDGSTWLKGDNIDQVTSVNGNTGAVTITIPDLASHAALIGSAAHGLGGASTKNVGTTANDVAAGNHTHSGSTTYATTDTYVTPGLLESSASLVIIETDVGTTSTSTEIDFHYSHKYAVEGIEQTCADGGSVRIVKPAGTSTLYMAGHCVGGIVKGGGTATAGTGSISLTGAPSSSGGLGATTISATRTADQITITITASSATTFYLSAVTRWTPG